MNNFWLNISEAEEYDQEQELKQSREAILSDAEFITALKAMPVEKWSADLGTDEPVTIKNKSILDTVFFEAISDDDLEDWMEALGNNNLSDLYDEHRIENIDEARSFDQAISFVKEIVQEMLHDAKESKCVEDKEEQFMVLAESIELLLDDLSDKGIFYYNSTIDINIVDGQFERLSFLVSETPSITSKDAIIALTGDFELEIIR